MRTIRPGALHVARNHENPDTTFFNPPRAVIVFFVAAALILIVAGANTGLLAMLKGGFGRIEAHGVIEATGILAVAVMAVDIA